MARRDATALIELQRRHAASLYALAYGVLMDTTRAEQVVAEVFEQVWNTAELIKRSRGGVSGWLRQRLKARVRTLQGVRTSAA